VAEGVPARLSPAEARKFGLVVGAAFLVLAGVVAWRRHLFPAQVMAALGAGLIVFGVAAPKALIPVHRAWMGLALVISRVTTPIFLGIIYFGVITPIGLVRRMFGQDAVRLRPDGVTRWISRKAGTQQPDMTHQF
jgi:hypothetical protein